MAEIEIDGKKVKAEPGSMIIEAADNVGIWIPRFCYHKKLSIAANCRMCLVEVEKSSKPLPACATPITDGMKIYTRSKKAIFAQKAVMEFLLINHPLDCPICDQGGECELQDISMGYGRSLGEFTEGKRSVLDQNLGPLISTDMTRCIQCTRCVRFGTEIAGLRELGATGRGEHMEIGTFIERNIESEVSGNVIDLCPVGALTSKPFRFTARAWELQQRPSIAPHDCIGSNIFVHSRRNEVMRVVPRENESVNEIWLSDRDRYSYQGLYQQRLSAPMIKMNDQWIEVSWTECLEFVANGIKDCIERNGPGSVAALTNPNLTTEEYYLLQKWMRGLGSNNVDHRLNQRDFRLQNQIPIFPSLGLSMEEFEQCDNVILIGSDLRNEQPVFNLKLRKMAIGKTKVKVINSIDFEYNFDLSEKIIVPASDIVESLARITKLLQKEMNEISRINENESSSTEMQQLHKDASHYLEKVDFTNTKLDTELDANLLHFVNELMHAVKRKEKTAILLGAYALNHPEFSKIMVLANLIRKFTKASLGLLTEGPNAAGAWLAGFVPHRLPGGKHYDNQFFTAKEPWDKDIKAMVLVNMEPELDCAGGSLAQESLKNIPFIVAITPFESEGLKEIAQVMLPMTPFTETSGSFVNAMGQMQTFKEVVLPYEGSRPAWKIFRVLGNYCDLIGFDFNSIEEVRNELIKHFESTFDDKSEEDLEEKDDILKMLNPKSPWNFWVPTGEKLQFEKNHIEKQHKNTDVEIIRIGTTPLYLTDNLVRRAAALQETDLARKSNLGVASLNPSLAKKYQLTIGEKVSFSVNGRSVDLTIEIDPKVADHTVVIPTGTINTAALGPSYSKISIHKLNDSNRHSNMREPDSDVE